MILMAAARAMTPPTVGFSFTPSGLCFPYGLGAASSLAEAGALTSTTPLAGASGGALVAAVMALQGTGTPSVEMALEAALRVNHYCRERGTARFNLRPALAKELDSLLDDDACERLNAREARVGVGITRFTPLPRGQVVTVFSDNADVKNALLATSCIPFYFGRSPFVLYRGWPAVDGFFATPKSEFGAPDAPGANTTVRICPFEARRIGLAGDSISPPRRGGPRLKSLVSCALGSPPADPDFLIQLYEQGKADADRWLAANNNNAPDTHT